MLNPGDIAGGRYEIVRRLGEGGMAVVYEAVHTGTRRRCALKLVRPTLSKNKTVVEKFLSEAQFAGRIGRHPHIVDVFDSGLDERIGAPFIAMELLEGQALDDYVAQRGALPPLTVAELMRQLGKALTAAHRAGVVHRDLKPANLFVTGDHDGHMQLKVLDFGIAKVLSDAQATATHIGTPLYAAPEQMGDGLRKMATMHGVTVDRAITPATDIWGVAMIAYELVCGRDPGGYWHAQTLADLMLRLASNDRPIPSATMPTISFPPGFDAWFLRCTEIDATRRPATSAEAIDALCALLDPHGASLRLTPAHPSQPAPGHASHPSAHHFQHASYPAQGSYPSAPHLQQHASYPSAPAPQQPSYPSAPPPQQASYAPPLQQPSYPSAPFPATGPGAVLEVRPPPRRSPVAMIAVGAVSALGVVALLVFLFAFGASDDSSHEGEKKRRRRAARASTEAPEPAPSMATIHVDSSPPSIAFLDGHAAGPTPSDLEVPPGSHEITFQAPGFLPKTERVDVEAGERQKIKVTLEADEHTPEPPPEPEPPEPPPEPEPEPEPEPSPGRDPGDPM